jgi:hypothetical protein
MARVRIQLHELEIMLVVHVFVQKMQHLILMDTVVIEVALIIVIVLIILEQNRELVQHHLSKMDVVGIVDDIEVMEFNVIVCGMRILGEMVFEVIVFGKYLKGRSFKDLPLF